MEGNSSGWARVPCLHTIYTIQDIGRCNLICHGWTVYNVCLGTTISIAICRTISFRFGSERWPMRISIGLFWCQQPALRREFFCFEFTRGPAAKWPLLSWARCSEQRIRYLSWSFRSGGHCHSERILWTGKHERWDFVSFLVGALTHNPKAPVEKRKSKTDRL